MAGPTRFRWVLVIALVFVGVMQFAALGAGESVRGTLTITDDGEKVPVSGVVIVVSQDGSDVGSTETDANGKWEVALPGPGVYAVRLDTSTLPEGASLADPDRDELPAVDVKEGASRAVAFPLGEGTVAGVGLYERTASLLVSGLKLGAIIALAAVGLSLIYGVTGLVNFAQGEMVTLGAVAAFFFHGTPAGPGWPLWAAGIAGVVVGAAFGWLQDAALWRPLRKRQMGLISMMVVSIGLAFALRNLILIILDGEPRQYPDYAGQPATEILGVTVVPKHLVVIAVTVVILLGIGLFLQRTRAGTALRAVSDDKDLAESSGIDVNQIISLTWVLAGALAALSGVFLGLTEAVQWDMGFRLLLLIFAAVVLGGLGTIYGAMAGGFIVGVTVEVSTLVFPSELKAGVALALLIAMLLVRPQGLFGSKERIG